MSDITARAPRKDRSRSTAGTKVLASPPSWLVKPSHRATSTRSAASVKRLKAITTAKPLRKSGKAS